jgi:hypothetical protein
LAAHAATKEEGVFLFFEKLKIFQKIKTPLSWIFIGAKVATKKVSRLYDGTLFVRKPKILRGCNPSF